MGGLQIALQGRTDIGRKIIPGVFFFFNDLSQNSVLQDGKV